MKKFIASTVSAAVVVSSAFAADDTKTDASVAPAPLFTQSKPAVDGLNGEVWVYGGAGMPNAISLTPSPGLSVAREETGSNFQAINGVTGVLTAPLGHSFGFQADLSTGTFRGAVEGSGAGHLFWRDPSKGLIGLYGSGQYWAGKGGKSTWNIGPELEGYFNQLTLGGTLGAQGFDFYNVNWNGLVPFYLQQTPCNHQPIRFFDNLSAKYYPTDDLMLMVGHSYVKGDHAIRAGAEYIPQQFRGGNTAASLFVDGAYGWDKGSMVMGGVKVYLGNHDKPLIRRHREDDPSPNWVSGIQDGLGQRVNNIKPASCSAK